MAKNILAWILTLAGIYQILSLLVESIPGITGTWGLVIGIIVLVIGGAMLMKKKA